MKSFFDVYQRKTSESEKLFKRARDVMPGGVSHNIHYFPPYPFFLKKAKGPRIWDVDGNGYIDLWMGHYTHILGHHPEIVVEAIEKQLEEGIHWGILFEKQVEWAELVRELIPCAEMVRFCCSGTEATMYAVRLARAFTGKKIILKIAGGWHGANSDLSFGIKMPYEKEETPGLPPEVHRYTKLIPFNDLGGTMEVIDQNRDDLAGIILEPVPGEGGFIPATTEYLEMLRSETERLGALLIFDEVISGFRVALGGAQERFGITPDLTTLGKIMGGGLPVGALVGRREILEKTSPERKVDKWERILIGGGTFSSHPFTVAAGLAVLRYLKEEAEQIYPILEARGQKVRERVQESFRREGIEALVTGIGSLFQTHFPSQKGVMLDSPHSIHRLTDVEKREIEFRIRMLTKGVHVMHGGGSLSMAHSDKDIEEIVQATREVAKEMADPVGSSEV
ncbi:MAG: aminotransferase class III-fold pyridoxal phosphate-dependent enzyme [Syntrophaceae bacterium]|nr:aminotransferase class III-fold pyridoxal phosphate-dependent enzyme [Syntrophaceae bacterium]